MSGGVCNRKVIHYSIQQNEIIVDLGGSATAQQQTDNFNGKTLLITGGTGTFGNTVVEMVSKAGFSEIRISSRKWKSRALSTCATG
jgi:FlaA1/EpsC-like NDP-sugar epimerase